MVDKITVDSRRAGMKETEGVRWISGGAGDFEVESHQLVFAKTSERIAYYTHHLALQNSPRWRANCCLGCRLRKPQADQLALPLAGRHRDSGTAAQANRDCANSSAPSRACMNSLILIGLVR